MRVLTSLYSDLLSTGLEALSRKRSLSQSDFGEIWMEMFSKRIWGINKFALMVISVIWCFKYHLAGQLLTCPLLTTRWFCTHLRCFLILDFSSAFVICQADALWVICQLSPKQYFFIWIFYTQLINFTLPPLLPLTDQIPVRLYQTRNFNQYQVK